MKEIPQEDILFTYCAVFGELFVLDGVPWSGDEHTLFHLPSSRICHMAGEVKGLLCGCRYQGLLNAAYTKFYSRIFKLESGYHIIMIHSFGQKYPVVPSVCSLVIRNASWITLSKPACILLVIRKLVGQLSEPTVVSEDT